MTESSENDWLLLNALVDHELDAAASLSLEKRLENEPPLAAAYARIVATKRAVERLEKPDVTTDFYEKMAALASPTVVPFEVRPPPVRQRLGGDWRAIAASLVVTACLASGSTYMLMASNPDTAVEDAVVSGHQRSLLASNTVDVLSSDRHTVRPWFDSKLGLSPPATDFADKGFSLVGGRVDVVEGKTVPTLVYRRGKHLISVVAIPEMAGEKAERAPKFSTAAGYNIARWSHGGFHYWAISDVSSEDLGALAESLAAN